MSCPDIGILEQDLTFTAEVALASGAAADADSLPTYKVYEETSNTEIASGTMAKLDDAGTVGFYATKLELTTANGYESIKTYTIRIKATVAGVASANVLSFIVLGQSDLTVATGDALTTTARFKLYKGITASTDDTLIGQLITRATNAIQVFCNRDFVETTYREFEDGDGQSELILNQHPVISVIMLGIGRQDAFQIMNTSSDAYFAQVSISESGIALEVRGGANAGGISVSFTGNDTLSDLITTILALDKGWSIIENTDLGYWSPIELLPTGKGLSCLNYYASPQIPEEPQEEYTTDIKAGILKYFGRFNRGSQNIVVRYSAGYAEIPGDLEQICIDLVDSYYSNRNLNTTLKREKIGDYEYENAIASTGSGSSSTMPQNISQRLLKWSSWA